MRKIRENLLVRFSLASFIIMASLAFGLALYLSNSLGHQLDDMNVHNAAMATHNAMMAAGSFDSMSQQSMSDDPANDQQDRMAMIDTMLPTVDGSDAVDSPVMPMGSETEMTMDHIIESVSNIKTATVGIVGGAFIVLYASLVFIVWGGWTTINRQRASLLMANGDMELANRELKTFTIKLENSNQELQDFASIAAHDLQEPLRKVQAFGDRLKTKYAEALEEQGKEYLNRMQDASGRMATLINDLLTYSRVTSKGQPYERIDLNIVASEVVSDLETRIEELEGRVDIEDLPTIDADAMQMRQLFQNVLGNALKYHKPGEAPIVKVRATVLNGPARNGTRGLANDDLCEITFEDNGIGFDEKYLDRIFGIFQRLQTRGEYEGTGVGLAVCRKIVDRHSGTITARSRPDHGATFIVTLPVKQRESEGVISQ
ncbi:MAG: hypothetical protein IIC21_06010 [Chloroflexi bacterium]|nr:hypothetical protein [Chloroflexota bacterium]